MTPEEFEEVRRECEYLGIEVYPHTWTQDEEFMEWCIWRMIPQDGSLLHFLMPLNLGGPQD